MTITLEKDAEAELTRLIEILQDTQERILALTQRTVDAVLPSSGTILLLPETQAHFRSQADNLRSVAEERTAMLDSLPALIVMVDPSGTVLSTNTAAVATPTDLRAGENCLDRWRYVGLSDEDAEHIVSEIEAVLARRSRHFRHEYALPSLDGTRWLQLDASPLYGGGGGAVIMEMDITERKVAEARQRASEGQLQQAQRLEALGRLTGGVAHDFNNLLTVILGNAELLESRLSANDPLRDSAELVRIAAEKSAALTSRLLTFGRRQNMEAAVVDIGLLLRNAEMLLEPLVGSNVTIDIEIDGEGLCGLVDVSQFENAVMNLCLNARDAMPRGGAIGISVGLARIDDARVLSPELVPGDYVVVGVRDHGTGMDPETLSRSVEPFFTTKSNGSGLGLSMVHGFLRQSGGALTIESTAGWGTFVRMWIPRLAIGLSGNEEPDMPLPRGDGERILLVEDNPLVRQHVQAQLENLGYRTHPVESPSRALDILRSDAPLDILLTDVVMPGEMDGFALAQLATELRPGLAVLLTTGFAGELAPPDDGRPRADILMKPYHRTTLATRLRASLDDRPTAKTPA